MAHELGHAQHRDGLRKIIQTGGSSFLIGLLFGDVTGGGAVLFAARSIVDASYSREAESRPTAFTIKAMHGLGRSPRPMGEFLVRITGGGRIATVIDSHPLSADRLDRMTEGGRSRHRRADPDGPGMAGAEADLRRCEKGRRQRLRTLYRPQEMSFPPAARRRGCGEKSAALAPYAGRPRTGIGLRAGAITAI